MFPLKNIFYEKQSSCRITSYGSYIGILKAIKYRRRVFCYVLVGLLIKLRVIAWKVVCFWGCFASFQWYSLVMMFWGVFLIVLEYNFILKLMTYKNFWCLMMYVKSYLNRFFIKILKFSLKCLFSPTSHFLTQNYKIVHFHRN